MQKIPFYQYTNCTCFADACPCGNVYPLSIASHYQHGDIYANTTTDFKTVLFWHHSGFAFLAGKYDEKSLAFIYHILSDKNKQNNRRFILFNNNETIDSYFKQKENIMLEVRYFFTYKNRTDNEPFILPEHCELKAIDDELLAKIDGKVTPAFSWRTPKDFLSKGKGYCIKINEEIAAWAFSAAISDKEIDIGVETKEKYREMGLAAIVAKAMVQYTLTEHKNPVWACHSQNIASAKLAQKLGFEKISKCSIIESKNEAYRQI